MKLKPYILLQGAKALSTRTSECHRLRKTFSVNMALYQEMCLPTQNQQGRCGIHAGPVCGAAALPETYTKNIEEDVEQVH